nr:TonB-dependent receptor plug domain-containing protein [Steroidobacteraceae bacterium]
MNGSISLFVAIAATLASAPAALAQSAAPHLDEVIVTASALGESRMNVVQPTAVLTGEELARQVAPSLGETLSDQPGVSSTYFGPAASRPVIRGLGGDRVQLLVDGNPSLDASGLSEDHAAALEPSLADQVEIIRGPATLLFGSGAAGGVVNVVTNRIHTVLPDGASGSLELRGDTPLDERAAAGRVDLAAGSLALHFDGAWRETDDASIPG